MAISNRKLPLEGNAIILSRLASDYLSHVEQCTIPPSRINYKVVCAAEAQGIGRSARKAALKALEAPGLKKVAFDTRRIDQETTRNPRKNAQYWHRSQEFIDADDQAKIDNFTKLYEVTQDIRNEYGTSPDWHESYARVLDEAVERILRVKIGDNDMGRSQLAYLEQLLFARYGISMEQLETHSMGKLRAAILQKDEPLMKRGITRAESQKKDGNMEEKFMDLLSKAIGGPGKEININGAGNSNSTNDALAALFGAGLRRDGEKKVERTVTITIRDEVKD